jgi:hypothetical protein
MGAAAMVGRNFYFENAGASILGKTNLNIASVQQVVAKTWGVGPALSFLVFGIVWVAIFAIRVSMGFSQMPISLRGGTLTRCAEASLPNRPSILLWLMIGPQNMLLEQDAGSFGASV